MAFDAMVTDPRYTPTASDPGSNVTATDVPAMAALTPEPVAVALLRLRFPEPTFAMASPTELAAAPCARRTFRYSDSAGSAAIGWPVTRMDTGSVWLSAAFVLPATVTLAEYVPSGVVAAGLNWIS